MNGREYCHECNCQLGSFWSKEKVQGFWHCKPCATLFAESPDLDLDQRRDGILEEIMKVETQVSS